MEEPYIRWEDRRNRTPVGQLQNAAPPRELVEVALERKTPFPGGDRFFIEGNPGGSDYHRHHFTAGPCYLPPDEQPPAPRWRWWRDPLVIGAAIGIAILFAVFFAVVP